MIPQLHQAPNCDELVVAFVSALNVHGFSGDVATDYASRLTMATDNSIYQQIPQAVCFPRSTADVTVIMRLASEPKFQSLVFVPRGGGTGTNGQSLSGGIVIDLSRYMNRILEWNFEEGWVRVEAGVIKDQLNQFLKPHGYFFSPELSTSNRATLGGMINTDASGQGSLVYGKTSDHVLGLRSVLLDGELLDTFPMPIALAHTIAAQNTSQGRIYNTVLDSVITNRALILEKFPALNRFLTGYDLRHVLSDDELTVDLSRILTGSEGSLAIITEAKLNITPLPTARYLVNIKYDSFDSALRNAPFLLAADALSVETVDSTVLNLAKEDIIWDSVSDLLRDVPDKIMQGINIVEFAGGEAPEIEQKVAQLATRLDELIAAEQSGVIGYQICHQLAEVERIYAMRKKAVGLLGNAKGAAKPIPFVEDTAVPPAHLADYITEFRALLDRHQLTYGMFGHVDAGVLHVRPALDLLDKSQTAKIREISDQVVALTAKYGGLLWGEHGKGFRSEYSPSYFGDALYTQLRRIKAAFDARHRLNPGKICTPLDVDAPIANIDATLRADYDRQIPVNVRETFSGALNCNGNGLCFNFDVHSPMCPSMKISGDRIHSPKGRAALVREWLRLIDEHGMTPQSLENALSQSTLSLRQLLAKIKNSWRAKRGDYDFSHEVHASMMGCLSCKACSTQCPIKIDVPAFRSQFLHLYHSRYLRDLKDHIVANVEMYSPWMAATPRVFNFFFRQKWVDALSQKTAGMTDLPLLTVPTLKKQLKLHPTANMTFDQLALLPDDARQDYVLIIQDAFTSFYDANVVIDFVQLIDKLGAKPVVLPFMPNGKPKHVKGFLPQFSAVAKKTAEKLNRFASLNIPMVAVDPAMALVYRDEYHVTLGKHRGDFHILLAHEWLYQQRHRFPALEQSEGAPWYLFAHCTEGSALPDSIKKWQLLFSKLGEKLESVNVGCCGMAGTYGHEVQNQASSKALYALSWQKRLADKRLSRCLATGYSCRSQVQRIEHTNMQHPLQALLMILSSNP